MKTLVNKNNPAIRITAEVETLYDKSRCVKYYYIKDLRLGLLQENWILVEEIKGNLEEIPSNVSIEEEPEKLHIDKPRGYKLASEDATANGFNQLKEPVDLEKALNDLDNAYFDLDGIAVRAATYYLTVDDLKDIARDFYELGLKARKK